MSCSLSQKLAPDEKLYHRFLISYSVTDEIFGIASNVEGRLNPFYNYGATTMASPAWTIGTFLGAAVGAILPGWAESAFSVALYGMFLAIIIPPAKKDKVVLGLIVISFASSYLAGILPGIASISSGTRTILLKLVISAVAAIVVPHKEEAEHAS